MIIAAETLATITWLGGISPVRDRIRELSFQRKRYGRDASGHTTPVIRKIGSAMSDESAKNTPACPQCGSEESWDGLSWCPSCGYYPAANRQIDTGPRTVEEEIYEHWWQIVPIWLWTLLTGVVMIFVLSVAVRLMFDDSPIRTLWSYAQVLTGIVALGTVHMMAYFYSTSRSDRLGPLDMILQPLKTWRSVFEDLPEPSNLVCSLGFSIAAIVFGFFIVDGIDVVGIMQADATARQRARAEQEAKDAAEGKKKTSAMGALIGTAKTIAQAQQAMNPTVGGPPPANLEDALNSFAGSAPISGDGTIDSLTGGRGGGRPSAGGGIGAAVQGIAGPGGIDVDSYVNQQRLIASGGLESSESTDTAEQTESHASDLASSAGRLTQLNDAASGHSLLSRTADKSTARILRYGPPTNTGTKDSLDPQGPAPLAATSTSNGATTPEFHFHHSDLGSLVASGNEIECLILGYTTNATGEIRSILLAAAPNRKLLRFVAKVPVDQVAPNVLATLLAKFEEIPASSPMVRCPYGGRWVQPELFCVVSFEGWTADERLHNVQVTRLMNTTAH